MARKPASSSKFGHLFGDTSDSPSISTRESRLSGTRAGDLYKDPLAALIPPVTATTNTTRGTATSVKATLSPPPAASSASKASPPGSTSNSRSSSRVQHHALFSSLTGDSGNSIFDSGSASSASAAKRDLFGDSTSISPASRRTSTPPLTKVSSTAASSSQQSSRVSTPPLGSSSTSSSSRVSTSALDPDLDPLGQVDGAPSKTDEDTPSVKSPLTPEPLTRTNSQASTRSHESSRSNRSALSHEVADDARSVASKSTQKSSSSGTGTTTPIKESQATLPPISTSVRKASSSRSSTGIDRKPASATIPDPIMNPLSAPSVPQSEGRHRPSGEWTQPQASISPPIRPSSSASSQSIDTFQSISRTASPMHVSVSRSGFERENDNASPVPSTRSKLVPMVIPDDGAEAFANDLFSAGPAEPFRASSTMRSSSVLDSGSVTSTRTQISAATGQIPSLKSDNSALPVLGQPGVGASTVGQPKTRSGFSLGEDVADSSNPWMNTLVDSLDQTTLGAKKVDYTQSAASDGASFLPEVAFTLPTSTSTVPFSTGASSLRHSNSSGISSNSTLSSNTLSSYSPTTRTVPMPSLDEDVGGFEDIFSSLRSKKNPSPLTGPSSLAPTSSSSRLSTTASGADSLMSGLPTWNVVDAVEAAAMDPEFLGPRPLENPGTAKVLAMMQMPKDALDKDISAQEVFDNPWE
ncbi:hypothetical protein EMPS_11318 [Entomortierella parvispora]|uniref:Uncharacterized protein n=1 Tax=Entomortierella parvispora TaxID=205924 RepID=A0A9P3HLI3_9FUNG|nr:hypothetical protein EMPS_11318 [Entomortierella parvispora]